MTPATAPMAAGWPCDIPHSVRTAATIIAVKTPTPILLNIGTSRSHGVLIETVLIFANPEWQEWVESGHSTGATAARDYPQIKGGAEPYVHEHAQHNHVDKRLDGVVDATSGYRRDNNGERQRQHGSEKPKPRQEPEAYPRLEAARDVIIIFRLARKVADQSEPQDARYNPRQQSREQGPHDVSDDRAH